MAKISKNLKRLRAEKKLTQDALAEKISVTRQAVSSWENDRTQPDIDMLVALSAAMEVDIEELIYGEKRHIGFEADKTKYHGTLTVIFAILGSLLIGAGLVMLFIVGWQKFPLVLKTVFAFVPMLASQVFALFTISKKQDSVSFREAAAVLWCAGTVATVALINSVYALKSGYINCLIIDGALCLPIMYLLGAVTPLAFCSYSVIHWSIDTLGGRSESIFTSVFLPVISLFLLVLVLLFIPAAKKRLDEIRITYCVWITIISVTVLVSVIAASTALNFLPMLVLCGILLFSLDVNGEYFHAFGVSGLLLTVVPTIILSFGINTGSCYRHDISPDIITVFYIMGALAVAGIIINIKVKGFSGNPSRTGVILCAFIAAATAVGRDITELLVSSSRNDLPAKELFSVLPIAAAFAMGVCILIGGAKKMSFLYINLGFGIIAVEIYAILIMGDFDLLQNGLVFIVLGAALLLINFRMAKKKKAALISAQPEEPNESEVL